MSLFQRAEVQTSWIEEKLKGSRQETGLGREVSNVSWGMVVEQGQVPREELKLPGRRVQGAGNEGQGHL
jgi:hypothetical protein